MGLREAYFAGSWYPGGEEACKTRIASLMAGAPAPSQMGAQPVGGIVPHAGWRYSGRIAGAVFALLSVAPRPDTVILFGGHLGPRSRHELMAEGAWETPLGPVEVDGELARTLADEFQPELQPAAGAKPDNTLEVHLPFIRHVFPGARVLPVSPAATKEGVRMGVRCAQVARDVGRSVRVVGSTDLTHYGPGYAFTPWGRGVDAIRWVREVNDRRLVRLAMRLDIDAIVPEGLRHRNACCPGATAAALACMRELGARVGQEVAYGTSQEIVPSEDFVGYVGLVFWR
jgi:hypothetical protein